MPIIQYVIVLTGALSFLFTTLDGLCEDVYLTTSEYLPYTTEYTENHGYCTQIVNTVVKNMGITPVFKFYPWKRGQLNVKSGKVWATFPYSKNPEREQEYWFSRQPLFVGKVRFFYNRDYLAQGVTWQTLKDLKPYRIGGVRGYWYENDFGKAGLVVEYTNHTGQSLKKLKTGRIQLFPLNEQVGWYLIDQSYPEYKNRFGVLEKIFELSPSYLMVSKSYPDAGRLLKQFDDAFEELKKSGGYQDILERNGISCLDLPK